MHARRLSSETPPPADLHRLIGTVVSRRFRVLDVLHGGPHGTLYEVEPPGVGRSRRALKTLERPEAREPEALARLRRFVERARDLDDPHVARVHGVDTLPDGTPYLVAEWLPLGTLDDHLAHHGDLPFARIADLLRGVAAGLAALHARGLVHGDLRPGHVLVNPDRYGFERIVLIDAGLAPALEPAPGPAVDEALLHRAPERIAGRPPSAAADVYAFGVLAWRLLAGRLPVAPGDPRAAAVGPDPAAQVRWLHLHAAPERPSAQLSAPSFGPALEAVIGRALAKRPADRYPDGCALLDALDEVLDADDVEPAVEIDDADLERLFGDATPAPPAELPAATPPPPADEIAEPPAAEPTPARHPLTPWALAGLALGAAIAALSALW